MEEPFSQQVADMADSMGVALYQRFTLHEASLFLRISQDEVQKLQQRRKLAFVQLTSEKTECYGFQLVQYLVDQIISAKPIPDIENKSGVDRIIRSAELQKITGLSRSTIWRLERKGDFPARVPLSRGSVGWRLSDINKWVRLR